LQECRDRLRLAVAEAVIGIRRFGGDAHADQRDDRGDEIERGVSERAEHCNGARLHRRIGLDHAEDERRRERGDRRAAGQLAARLQPRGVHHGYCIERAQPLPARS
jgi:hypothetical protein